MSSDPIGIHQVERQGNVAERLYPLRTFGNESGSSTFYTCRLPCGTQVLLGAYRQEIVVLRFDAKGNYTGLETRPFRARKEMVRQDVQARHPNANATHMETIATQEFEDAIDAEVRAVRDALGGIPGPILVRRFGVMGYEIGIDPHPLSLHDARDQMPDNKDEIYQDERFVRLLDWEADGWFILIWGCEHYIDADGWCTGT